jgi:hypothetical protein
MRRLSALAILCAMGGAAALRLRSPGLTHGLDRRAVLAQAPAFFAACAAASAVQEAGAAEELKTYKDAEYGDSFLIPSGWELSENELSGGRKLVAAADPQDPNSNVFILYTPLAPDYTSLGSFGNIDYVANTFLPPKESDGISGRMIEQVAARGSYIYDYVIEQRGNPTRHLRTAVTVALEEGRGKRLVTLTAQCDEARHAQLAPMLKGIIESFKPA